MAAGLGTSRLTYGGKVVLAPMVRAGRLPMRLLALQYGADIVYSEELIDLKILKCKRVENTLLNTVDYISSDGKCQFRTCSEEKDKVVLQMGTADPDIALRTARMVEDDVAGIDVNMGCPKDYSVKGGMGAALLTEPDKVRAILTALVQGVRKPVTCKIRLLPSRADTLALVKTIESTGVAALAVHGRYKTERPEDHCHTDLIREVAESVSIPVIANGGSLNIRSFEDIIAFKEAAGCSSVMLARAALANPSVFRKEGPLPVEEVAKELVSTTLRVDGNISFLKYCLNIILKQFSKPDSPNRIFHFSTAAKTLEDISKVHSLFPYYQSLLAEREGVASDLPLSKQKELSVGVFCTLPSKKTRTDVSTSETESGLYELHLKYDKRHSWLGNKSPKTIVLEYSRTKKLPPPEFTILENDERLYRAIVTLGDWKYTSSIWSVSKKMAEHSASLVALTHCGVPLPTKTNPMGLPPTS